MFGKYYLLVLAGSLSMGTSLPSASTHTNNDDLVTTGINQCSPTGPGFCNLWIMGERIVAGSRWEVRRDWTIFNSACDPIGGGDQLPNGHHSLTSQLRWTVELDIAGGTMPQGGFWYAGRYTDLGAAYCEQCDVFAQGHCCRIAFQCN
jgi:hypothetical protein